MSQGNNTQQTNEEQKAFKTGTSIRKITMQTLQPIITKIEEHVSYLMTETNRLREKNHLLEQTVGNQKRINTQIICINNSLHNLQSYRKENEIEKEQERVKIDSRFEQIETNIVDIEKNIKKKEKNINDMFDLITHKDKKLNQIKNDFENLIVSCSDKVEQNSSYTRRLEFQFKNETEKLNLKIASLERNFSDRDEKYTETDEKMALYLNQRQEMREMMTSTFKRVENCVDIHRYHKDWRVIRLENEAMKEQVRKTIDGALTPEVRDFLPEMLERISDIRKVNRLQEQFKSEQKINNQQKQNNRKTLLKIQIKLRQVENNILANNTKHSSNFKDIRQMTQKYKSILDQTIQKLETFSKSSTKQITEISRQISTVESKLQNNINSLIEKSRQQIFSLVEEQIPKEEKDFFEQMKQFIPLLQSTKLQIMNRCDDITEFGKELESRLDIFNNRIVKIKGDVTIEMDKNRKKSKLIDQQIDAFKQNFTGVGEIVSSFTELFLILFSIDLKGEPSEVYVTYNDGIICEFSEQDSHVLYRKLKAHKQQMKKAVLGTITKLTDQFICDKKYSFLKCDCHKPSGFFSNVKDMLTLVKKQKEKKKQRRSFEKSRFPEVDASKTIELEGFTDNHANNITIGGNKDLLSQTLTSDYRTTILKRNQKSYRGRYSQAK